jgi:hypothetical protein
LLLFCENKTIWYRPKAILLVKVEFVRVMMDLPGVLAFVASGAAIAKDLGATAKDLSGVVKDAKSKESPQRSHMATILEEADAQAKLLGMVQQALDVQMAFLEARGALEDSARREVALQAKLDELNAFDHDAGLFEVIKGTQAGMFAMAKRAAIGVEREVRYCYSCFARRRISHFHFVKSDWIDDELKCETCSATFHVPNGKSGGTIQSFGEDYNNPIL